MFSRFCMFCALLGQIAGERLQDHWSSGSTSISLQTTAILTIANLQYFPLAPFARSIGSLMRLY